ncbi:MBL fold metallo-hydrolase [Azotobacter sp. CWF10]
MNTYPSSVQRVPEGRPTLADFLFRGEGRTPANPLPIIDPRASWARPVETGLRATWLGHSTVLLEIDGHRVLTDPVWGARVSPLPFLGPKRFHPVPVDIASLPPLDAVLVSHDHYDHLDYPSIRALAKLRVPFVTSLGVGLHLEAWGVPAKRIVELDWWERTVLPGGLAITAAPAHHYSGRGLRDRNLTLWSSFALRGERHAVFFSGDTGLSPVFTEIGQRLGPFDLVMIEVGAFHPAWGMCTWARTTPCRPGHSWAAGVSCRCTGALSTWRCIPGPSRRMCCWRTPRRGWSCRAWASRSSRPGSRRWSRGGVGWPRAIGRTMRRRKPGLWCSPSRTSRTATRAQGDARPAPWDFSAGR